MPPALAFPRHAGSPPCHKLIHCANTLCVPVFCLRFPLIMVVQEGDTQGRRSNTQEGNTAMAGLGRRSNGTGMGCPGSPASSPEAPSWMAQVHSLTHPPASPPAANASIHLIPIAFSHQSCAQPSPPTRSPAPVKDSCWASSPPGVAGASEGLANSFHMSASGSENSPVQSPFQESSNAGAMGSTWQDADYDDAVRAHSDKSPSNMGGTLDGLGLTVKPSIRASIDALAFPDEVIDTQTYLLISTPPGYCAQSVVQLLIRSPRTS